MLLFTLSALTLYKDTGEKRNFPVETFTIYNAKLIDFKTVPVKFSEKKKHM